MAGLFDTGDQGGAPNLSLLGALAGLGIMNGASRGQSTGQAVSGGLLGALGGYGQMQQQQSEADYRKAAMRRMDVDAIKDQVATLQAIQNANRRSALYGGPQIPIPAALQGGAMAGGALGGSSPATMPAVSPSTLGTPAAMPQPALPTAAGAPVPMPNAAAPVAGIPQDRLVAVIRGDVVPTQAEARQAAGLLYSTGDAQDAARAKELYDYALQGKGGFLTQPDGSQAPVAGGEKDPRYIYSAEAAKANAGVGATNATNAFKAGLDVQTAGPIAAATAAAKMPYDVTTALRTQEGAARFASPFTVRNPDGTTSLVNPMDFYNQTRGGGPALPGVPDTKSILAGNPYATLPSAPPPAGAAPRGPQGPLQLSPEQEARQKGIAEQGTKVIEEFRTRAEKSADALVALQSQQRLLDSGFAPNATAELRAAGSNFLQGVGVPERWANAITAGDPRSVKLFNGNANEIVIQTAKALGQNPTDADAKRLQATLATATDSRSAAQAIIDYATKKHAANVAAFGSLLDRNGVGANDPLRVAAERYAQAVPPAAPADPGASGVMTKLPDGAKRVGTYQGKAVYDLPDGSRVVAQ